MHHKKQGDWIIFGVRMRGKVVYPEPIGATFQSYAKAATTACTYCKGYSRRSSLVQKPCLGPIGVYHGLQTLCAKCLLSLFSVHSRCWDLYPLLHVRLPPYRSCIYTWSIDWNMMQAKVSRLWNCRIILDWGSFQFLLWNLYIYIPHRALPQLS